MGPMNYRGLKALARRADLAKGEKRRLLVEKLIKELPKLDPFEGFGEDTVWLAKMVARVKWLNSKRWNWRVVLYPCQKKSENQVKIVPPYLWPPLFPTMGVYDVSQNRIYIKEGLPDTTRRQILKHENAHKEWYLDHQLIRKITILLFCKPAL